MPAAGGGATELDAPIEVVLIAAVAENGVIGRDGGMPWHYPADLAHFKETTMGHPVIMGRRTYESIADRLGGPLPGRTNVVLTRSGVDAPEAVVEAGSVEEAVEAAGDAAIEAAGDAAIEAAGDAADEAGADAAGEAGADAASDTGTDRAYVAGGATVYEQFLPLADEMVVTEVPESPEGDVRFPAWGRDAWTEVDRETTDDLAFVTYERR